MTGGERKRERQSAKGRRESERDLRYRNNDVYGSAAQRSNDRRCDRWRNVLLSGVKWRVVRGAVGKIGDTRRTVGREEWSAWKLSVARPTGGIPRQREGGISLRGNADSLLLPVSEETAAQLITLRPSRLRRNLRYSEYDTAIAIIIYTVSPAWHLGGASRTLIIVAKSWHENVGVAIVFEL